MNNAKVMVTKEVAEAIEHLRTAKGYPTDNEIIVTHARGEQFVIAKALNELTTLELAGILCNGYTVEKSPEEKVREYYDRCVANRAEALVANLSNSVECFGGQAIGASITLDILGIKVEGVNV